MAGCVAERLSAVVEAGLRLAGEVRRNGGVARRAARVEGLVLALREKSEGVVRGVENGGKEEKEEGKVVAGEALETMELVIDVLQRVVMEPKDVWWGKLAMTVRGMVYNAALADAEEDLSALLHSLDTYISSAQSRELEDEQDALDAARQLRQEVERKEAVQVHAACELRELIAEVSDATLSERLQSKVPEDGVHLAFEDLRKWLDREAASRQASINWNQLIVHEDEVLGNGSFGEVLGATWRPGSRRAKAKPVAVKRVPARMQPQPAVFEEAQERLRREALEWASWQPASRYLVKLEGVCLADDGHFVLVMERCEMSLHTFLHEHKGVSLLEDTKVDVVMRGIARGMSFLHSRGLIHRDINPRNILLSVDSGNAKLCDFGLCTSRFAGAATGEVIAVQGSPAYAAPEVLEDPALWTPQADVFSFAVTCWEILHRKTPWAQSLNDEEIVDMVKGHEGRPAFDHGIVPHTWMEDLICKAWRQDPGQRPTAGVLVADLEAKRTRTRRSTRIVQGLLKIAGTPRGSLLGILENQLGGDDEPQVAASLEALCDLLGTDATRMEDEPAAVKRLRITAQESDGVARLASVLRRFPDSARVLALACKSLRFLGRVEDKEGFFLAAQEQALDDLLVEVMRVHRYNAEVQLWALGAMFILAVNNDDKGDLMDPILEAMRIHQDNTMVQEHACGALWNLAFRTKNQVKLMELEAAEALLRAMAAHRQSAGVQQNACGALRNLAVNDDNEVKLMELGAATEILEAMRAHRTSAAVQEQALRALQNLAVNNKDTLVDQGAVDAILEAMHRHRGSATVQTYACGALRNLAVDNPVDLARMGVAKAVVQAMHTHPTSEPVQRKACEALRNLAVNKDIQDELMRLGAPEAILVAMRTHAESAAVQQSGCGALWNLGTNNEDNKAALMKLGAAEAILDAMRLHQGSAVVQEKACGALKTLAWTEGPDRAAIRRLGAGDLVLAALRTHGDVEDTVKQCLFLMRRLVADDAAYFDALAAKGVTHELDKVARKLPSLSAEVSKVLATAVSS